MRNSGFGLIAIFAVLVVVSFSATVGYLGYRARAIDQMALDISENAAPSILHLSAARSDIKELPPKIMAYLEEANGGIFHSPGELLDVQARIHKEFRIYRNLSEFPGEHTLSERIRLDMERLDDALADFIVLYSAQRLQEARRTEAVEIKPTLRQLINAINDTIDFNAQHSSELAQRIRKLRLEVAHTARILNILTTIWTLGLVVVLGYGIRRSALRQAEHQLAKERAAELEQFAGRVAHDILNPLSVVSYSLSLLTQELTELSEKQSLLLTRGRKSVDRIQRILDGLLKFACAGAHPEPGAQADARVVLSELEPELQAQAAAAGVLLQVEPFTPRLVACSPGILSSVSARGRPC
jgi:signal transduction histidine kinase